MFHNPVAFVGRRLLGWARTLGGVVVLVQKTVYWLFKARPDVRNTAIQMNEIGVRSFPVTSLTALFTGMVLALQTGYSFRKVFNEPLYVGTVVGLSLLKELGPVLTALVVAGRVGAAIAAELGTMNVTEQIDALYTLGTNPVRYLVVPRFLACLVMVPLLTVYADLIGILGGFGIAHWRLGIPAPVFWDEINAIGLEDGFHGLIKSVAFALIIVITACYKGIRCQGGAEGVGQATTSTVVVSMVMVLVSDYFLSSLLVSLGVG
ncbi:MAG TPA: ABC transporter permease [Elusimicrobiota bacterium]|nr:ABC transporter permease [Elusimicrobiota bacterium]